MFPRVITQARGQNNKSMALKWGIVAQILLEIQQNLWKYEFSNFCMFVKKMAKLLYKITEIEKCQKNHTFSFNHNFKSIWAIETYNTSF